ncbi:hypothetical protein GCM10027566_00290 [Arachidicoccus ginsenosidivorans]
MHWAIVYLCKYCVINYLQERAAVKKSKVNKSKIALVKIKSIVVWPLGRELPLTRQLELIRLNKFS